MVKKWKFLGSVRGLFVCVCDSNVDLKYSFFKYVCVCRHFWGGRMCVGWFFLKKRKRPTNRNRNRSLFGTIHITSSVIVIIIIIKRGPDQIWSVWLLRWRTNLTALNSDNNHLVCVCLSINGNRISFEKNKEFSTKKSKRKTIICDCHVISIISPVCKVLVNYLFKLYN